VNKSSFCAGSILVIWPVLCNWSGCSFPEPWSRHLTV